MPGLHFPGGGVEKNETAHTAMARELVEEAGVVLSENAELLGIYSNHRYFRNDHVLLYRARRWEQGRATSRGEIAEIVWANPKNPPEGTVRGTRARLEEIFGPADSTHHW